MEPNALVSFNIYPGVRIEIKANVELSVAGNSSVTRIRFNPSNADGTPSKDVANIVLYNAQLAIEYRNGELCVTIDN